MAKVLLLDDERIRQWRLTFERDGIDGLVGFHYGGRHSFLSAEQEDQLQQWVSSTLLRTTREVGAYNTRRALASATRAARGMWCCCIGSGLSTANPSVCPARWTRKNSAGSLHSTKTAEPAGSGRTRHVLRLSITNTNPGFFEAGRLPRGNRV